MFDVDKLNEQIRAGNDAASQNKIELLQKLAAAFVLEVGSAEASKYDLVEEWDPDSLSRRWHFERRRSLTDIPID